MTISRTDPFKDFKLSISYKNIDYQLFGPAFRPFKVSPMPVLRGDLTVRVGRWDAQCH